MENLIQSLTDTKQDILNSDSEITVKSLNVGKIDHVEGVLNEHTTSISELQTLPYFTAVAIYNYTLGEYNEFVPKYRLTTQINNELYSYDDTNTGIVTFKKDGNYLISGSVNFNSVSFDDRVVGRLHFLINNLSDKSYGAGFGYIRLSESGHTETLTINNIFVSVNSGDEFKPIVTVAKSQNTDFTSDLTGLEIKYGGTLHIQYLG